MFRVGVGDPAYPQHAQLRQRAPDGTYQECPDLYDDQLWEVLEAVQMEVARLEGVAPHTGYPREIFGSLE